MSSKDKEQQTATPLYDEKCIVCGQSPVVGMTDSEGNTYSLELCGPCCFGEADCINPENW